jgi:hypothetical protein
MSQQEYFINIIINVKDQLTYKFATPPSLPQIFLAASTKVKEVPPLTSCCTVLIVSNGANIVLEQAAANPEASVFFRPSVMAEFVGLDVT